MGVRALALLAVVALAGVFLFQVQTAHAADNSFVTMTAEDTNDNGKIDLINVVIDNDSGNTATVHDTSGWAVTYFGNPRTIDSVSIDGSASADPLQFDVNLDENASGFAVDTTTTNYALEYTPQGTADTGTEYNDSADTQLTSISPSFGIGDLAAPVLTKIAYYDNDEDGRIDRFDFIASETMNASSTLAADDLTVANAGDFTGIGFTNDTTDVITGATNNITFSVTAGEMTEATVIDTHEDSGSLDVDAADSFTLEDAGSNINSFSAGDLVGLTDRTDVASPQFKSVFYRDSDQDGRVSHFQFNFSERLDASQTSLSENDFSVSNVGDFTGLSFGSDTTDQLITNDDAETIEASNAPAVFDTRDDSGSLAFEVANTINLVEESPGNGTIISPGPLSLTVIDSAPPAIYENSPDVGASGVANDTNVVLDFTESVDTTDAESAFSLTNGGPVSGTFAWSDPNGKGTDSTLTFTPDNNLPNDTFTVEISPTAVNSAFGNDGLSPGITYDFSTFSGSGNPPPPSTVPVTQTECNLTNPNGDESLTAGDATDIVWSSQGSGIDNVNISYSSNNGADWDLIVAGTDDDGLYTWDTPDTLDSDDVLVRVDCRDAGGGVRDSDESDATFSVRPDAAAQPSNDDGSGSGDGEQDAQPTDETTDGTTGLPAGIEVGDLLKLPNDGDPTTYLDTAVYYIGVGGKRHPFPNGDIFKSWFADFSDVQTVAGSDLSQIPLGDPVMVRPGTHWVKIQSVPETYYVAPDYTLRHIADEQTAQRLGGDDWNTNIIDISPTLFNNFNMGDPIAYDDLSNTWPEASLVTTPDDATAWYVQNQTKREVVDSDAFFANHFQNRFKEETADNGWQSLPVGTPISAEEDTIVDEELTP
jgi:hypothetical protein